MRVKHLIFHLAPVSYFFCIQGEVALFYQFLQKISMLLLQVLFVVVRKTLYNKQLITQAH